MICGCFVARCVIFRGISVVGNSPGQHGGVSTLGLGSISVWNDELIKVSLASAGNLAPSIFAGAGGESVVNTGSVGGRGVREFTGRSHPCPGFASWKVGHAVFRVVCIKGYTFIYKGRAFTGVAGMG